VSLDDMLAHNTLN